jgi:cellobiose-specific phosphotransferase system component IIC
MIYISARKQNLSLTLNFYNSFKQLKKNKGLQLITKLISKQLRIRISKQLQIRISKQLQIRIQIINAMVVMRIYSLLIKKNMDTSTKKILEIIFHKIKKLSSKLMEKELIPKIRK